MPYALIVNNTQCPQILTLTYSTLNLQRNDDARITVRMLYASNRAAIHAQVLAVNEGCLLGGQEDDGGGNLFGSAGATEFDVWAILA